MYRVIHIKYYTGKNLRPNYGKYRVITEKAVDLNDKNHNELIELAPEPSYNIFSYIKKTYYYTYNKLLIYLQT